MAARPSAPSGAGPQPEPGQPPLDVRIEQVAGASQLFGARPVLPSLGGLLRYSIGDALTPADRRFDFVFAIARPQEHALLARRLAYHSASRTPALGLLLGNSTPRMPRMLTIPPWDWDATFGDLALALFAPLLAGLICADWTDVLDVLDRDAPLRFASATGMDAAEVASGLAARLDGRLAAAHLAICGAAEAMRLADIRCIASSVRKRVGEQCSLLFSAPFGRCGGRPWWGAVLATEQ